MSITEGILTILLVGDRKIRKLNKEFFHKDSPTDVLSFSYGEKRNFDSPLEATEEIEGDIIVSLDTVLDGEDEGYLSDEERVFFYVIHGVLHIIGHEHAVDKKKSREMRKLETEVFKKVTGKEVA